MFRRLPEAEAPTLTVLVEGTEVRMVPGESAAAAILLVGLSSSRIAPATGEPRAPYCMMGACFECLLVIDGVPSRQGCLVPVRDGMTIRRQAHA